MVASLYNALFSLALMYMCIPLPTSLTVLTKLFPVEERTVVSVLLAILISPPHWVPVLLDTCITTSAIPAGLEKREMHASCKALLLVVKFLFRK